jgi:hypothetical protein
MLVDGTVRVFKEGVRVRDLGDLSNRLHDLLLANREVGVGLAIRTNVARVALGSEVDRAHGSGGVVAGRDAHHARVRVSFTVVRVCAHH